jgi:hypothetical protein
MRKRKGLQIITHRTNLWPKSPGEKELTRRLQSENPVFEVVNPHVIKTG